MRMKDVSEHGGQFARAQERQKQSARGGEMRKQKSDSDSRALSSADGP